MTGFTLHPFPGQDSGGMTIQGAIERTDQTIALAFLLQGDPGDLILPPMAGRTRADNLWQATCLEMFWMEEGKKNYWELNLAPSGGWNVYAFSDYRTGMWEEERIDPPRIETERTPESFSLTARLKIDPLGIGHASLRVGVSAVLQHRDGRLSYWALAHPEEKPDFHAPSTFLLRA